MTKTFLEDRIRSGLTRIFETVHRVDVQTNELDKTWENCFEGNLKNSTMEKVDLVIAEMAKVMRIISETNVGYSPEFQSLKDYLFSEGELNLRKVANYSPHYFQQGTGI